MQPHTEQPSVTGVPLYTVKSGDIGAPRTALSGSWFGLLIAPQTNWLVQKIQITLPLVASRQNTKLLRFGFSPSPMPRYTRPFTTSGADQPAAGGFWSFGSKVWIGWFCPRSRLRRSVTQESDRSLARRQ